MRISFSGHDIYNKIVDTMFHDCPSDWLVSLLNDYITELDLQQSVLNLSNVVTFSRVKNFVKWMKKQGFKVEYWECRDGNSAENWQWGIDIVDSCSVLMEYRLKRI